MKEILKDVVDRLKATVHANLITMKINEKSIRNLSEGLDANHNNTELNLIREENKNLLDVNKSAIQIQFDLSNLLNKYNTFFEELVVKDEEPEYEEYLQKTINKDIDYNIKHPFFSNDLFFKELVDYFAAVEEYELCDLITKRKRHSKN